MSQLSMSPNRASYHRGNSPASTISEDEESNNSEPNDLRTAQKSRHPGGGFGFSSFYSPPQSHGGSGSSGHSGGSGGHPQPQYVATNECRLIDYRGARIAAFLAANRQGEYLLCLPQAFELFLKHLVGGLHTVYTKLKRLDIVPIVCNVEQVRILRGLGAIQPGVNRCKLLSTHDFDVLYKDCTTARPGRPPKRSSGIPSPEPGNYGSSASLGNNQPSSNNLLPLLGFPNTKKARYSDECDFGNENLDLKQLNSGNVNLSSSANSAATAAAMLAANGYSAAFPFLQHLSAAANSMPNSQQHQQLVAAAAALGLPALPNRFGSSSPPPGVHPQTTHFSGNSGNSSTGGGNNAATPENPDFNPTAAYLWLLSQQQQHLPSAAAAAAALNLSSRGVPTNSFVNGSSNGASGNNGSHLSVNNSNASAHLSGGINTGSGGNSTSDIDKHGLISGSGKERSATKNHSSGVSAEHHRTLNGSTANGSLSSHNTGTLRKPSKDEEDEEEDETTDDEDDEVESNHSSRHSDNPVSSTGFNGTAASNPRGFLENVTSLRHNVETPPSVPNQGQTPPEHCLETLLRNIEGLLAIAAHNARQQQTQLQLQKAEIRAEYSSQLERERELREHVEKQLHEEQKIRIIYQKRFKKERKLRRKLEIELQQSPVSQQQLSQSLNLSSSTNKHHQQQQRSPLSQANGTASSATLTPVSSNTKSPANSLPPTPPPQNASSDEAD